MAGWPVGIRCSYGGGGEMYLWLYHVDSTRIQYAAAVDGVSGEYRVRFNPDQTYKSISGLGSSNAIGKAFLILRLSTKHFKHIAYFPL